MARFPKDLIIESDTDYVRFDFFKYKKGQGQFGSGGDNSRNAYSGDSYKKQFESAGLGSIYIYMPEDINSQVEASFSGKSMGIVGRDIMKSAGQAVRGDILGGASTLAGILDPKKLEGAGTAIAASLAAAGLNRIPGVTSGSVTPSDLLQGVGSEIFNPNVELFYEGPNLRTFDMNFKLTARNADEAKEIQTIIKTFRQAAAPSAKGSDTQNRFIKVPSYCEVRFMKGGKDSEYIPKYKMCNLTRVDVSFTADGAYTTFTDGAPVSIQLALSFQETKIIFSEDISEDGF